MKIITQPDTSPRALKRHVKSLIALKRKLDPIKREFKHLKREVIAELLEAGEDMVSTNIGDIHLLCSERETIDVKTLKKEHPHIYNQLLHKSAVNTIKFDFDSCEDEDE